MYEEYWIYPKPVQQPIPWAKIGGILYGIYKFRKIKPTLNFKYV